MTVALGRPGWSKRGRSSATTPIQAKKRTAAGEHTAPVIAVRSVYDLIFPRRKKGIVTLSFVRSDYAHF